MLHRRRLTWFFAVALNFGLVLAFAELGHAEGNAGTARTPAALPAVFVEDLKYTPAYAYLVAVVRPAKISQLRVVEGIPGADVAGPIPVSPSEIERAVASAYPSGPRRGLGASFTLQFRNEVPRAKIVAWLSPRARPFQQDARIYVNPDWQGRDLVLGFPDDRTILASTDARVIVKQMEPSKGRSEEPHALAAAFANLDPECHAAAAVDMDKLSHFIRMTSEDEAWWLREVFKPLAFAKKVQLSVNLARPDGLVLRVESDTVGDAEQLGKIAKAAVAERVESSIAALQESVGDRLPERIGSAQRRWRAILAATTLRHERDSCAITSRHLPAAADSLRLVGDFAALHVARVQSRLADVKFVSQMTSIGLAVSLYQDLHNGLLRDIVSSDGKPLLSWRVAILPNVDCVDLYRRFRLDEPWDSDHNLKLLSEMPQVYHSRGQQEPTKTSIQRVTGQRTAGSAKTCKEIKFPRRTLAVIESEQLVEWTRPDDFHFQAQDPRKGLPRGGSMGIMCDGSLAYLSPKTDPALLLGAFLIEGSKTDVERLKYQDNPFAISAPRRPVVPIADARLRELLTELDSHEESRILSALRLLKQPRPKSLDPRAQSVLDRVTPLLRSKWSLARGHALRTIRVWSFGARVPWKQVAELLQDPYEANRWLAVDILSEFAEPELVRAMLRLPEQDLGVWWPVVEADYARIAPDAAIPLLKDRDPEIRVRACSLIGSLGSDSQVGAIQAMLDDEHEACRRVARMMRDFLKQKGPLAAAVGEFNGDIVAALGKVAKEVEVDAAGQVIAVDLTQFDTPYRLVRSDYRLLGTLNRLKRLALTYSSITAAEMRYLSGLPLEELSLNYCRRLDDAVADSLRTMTGLRKLRLENTKVADETAKAVGGLRNLRELRLGATRVGDAGLAPIGQLPQLEILDLSGTRISDKGLAAIARRSTLRTLYLLDAPISDASIEYLSRLKNLEFMNLSGSGVTTEGLARLRAALPRCRGLD